jgi:hypothetical protein
MKVVQGDEVPIVEGPSAIRAGILSKQRILLGDPDSPGNFVFGLFYQVGDFYSPRHTHNFDQWRFQLEGECGFDRNGTMKPGMLSYSTEGAYYGPQTSSVPNVIAVVQFGGPSGSGYLGGQRVAQAAEEMKAFGRFEKGVFHRNDGVPGKKTQDSFQATWEYINKRPMVLAQPQYTDPIMMDTEDYRWMPLAGAAGVMEKAFGTFTDCKIRAARYKLDPGAAFTATGRGIFLVLSGSGSLEGEPYRRLTSLYIDTGECATYTAAETSEILLLGLPEIARMKRPLAEPTAAEAPDVFAEAAAGR